MKISLVAVEISYPGNLGALARLCYNFQVEKLILVKPQCPVDHKEAYQRAKDGKKYLDNLVKVNNISEIYQFADLLVALTGMTANNSIYRNPLPIIEVAKNIANKDLHIALVLGPENVGLSNKQISECDFASIIPLVGIEKSSRILNITHAASIALYEIQRAMLNDNNKIVSVISPNIKKHLMNYFDFIIENSMVLEEKRNESSHIFSSIISRALMSEREATKLLGIFHRIALTLGYQ